ncbi:lysine decarboxylation/transport transcriptional activator CadC [Vibrio sp. YIC-376]|uniref:lysine decarboxylation/transport transcriptional activator CadC n=1 Tax=Vibrio sp. YIC-376 TaxID=3136162 RepID=UPI00402ADF5D
MVGVYFQINDWVLSVDENKLYRQGREVTVEPRLMNLLYFLANNANKVFTREELLLSVWDGASVTEQVVTQSIFELRKLLRDGREEYHSYIMTVPKRGYKLVAEASEMTVKEFMASLRADSQNISSLIIEEQGFASNDANLSPIAHSLAKTAREMSQVSSLLPKISLRLQVLCLALLGIVVAMIGTFAYKKTEVDYPQRIDTHLIEFKIQNNVSNTGMSDDFADGLTKKLMSDVAQVSDYRVMQKSSSFVKGAKPGKSVMVIIRQNEDISFLEVEYRTHVSEEALFRRLYSLTDSDLRTVLQQASLSLMEILNVSDAKLKSTMLVAGLPMTTKALELLVQANHYLKVSDANQYQYGIELLENILEIEPDNAYVQAELLVAYHVQQAFEPERKSKEVKLKELQDALEVNVKMVSGQMQPRIYEALALHETVFGELAKAKRYLAQALKLRESVLSYVIRGKHAELDGNRKLADESYRDALYIDTSLETYLLCENLVFTSELEIDRAPDQLALQEKVGML